MLQAFIITLREGFESFLIVAIIIAYLRKTGRNALLTPAYWGIVVSVATSAIAGYLFSLASNQALWEGVLGLATAVLVASLVVHMWRIGKSFRKRIESELDSAAQSDSTPSAWIGVFLLTVVMITREGMETALLLGTLMFQIRALGVVIGALLGLMAAALVALLWSRYGHLVDLRRFFQVTAVFLLVFAFQLLLFGIHELAEANILPGSTALHDATEAYGPDGLYGKWLTFGLLLIPLLWLASSYLWRPRLPQTKSFRSAALDLPHHTPDTRP